MTVVRGRATACHKARRRAQSSSILRRRAATQMTPATTDWHPTTRVTSYCSSNLPAPLRRHSDELTDINILTASHWCRHAVGGIEASQERPSKLGIAHRIPNEIYGRVRLSELSPRKLNSDIKNFAAKNLLSGM